MFGTLRPGLCGTDRAVRMEYRRAYCGMCKSLGARFGTASRLMVNHDLVVYGLVVEAFTAQASATSSCHCPMAPWIKRPILDPQSPAMRAVAALQVIFADQWLLDKSVDGSRAAGPARRLLPLIKARNLAADLGLDLARFHDLAQRQQALEAQNAGLAEVAAPTAELLAGLFADIARLQGVSPEAQDPAVQEQLRRMGHALGRIIYTVDALDDLEQDRRRGHFNPLLTQANGRRSADPERLFAARALLDEDLTRLATAVETLPMLRGRALLNHILAVRLPQRLQHLQQENGLLPETPVCLPMVQPAAARGDASLLLSSSNSGTSGSDRRKQGRKSGRNYDAGCCGPCDRVCDCNNGSCCNPRSRRCISVCDDACCCSDICCDCSCDCCCRLD